MESKNCVICNTERSFDNFYNKFRESKPCSIKGRLNVTMKIKMKYQINKKWIMMKKRQIITETEK